MKKRTLSIILASLILLLSSLSAIAHSGRTDAQGGHRDNKNKSGLGYYHYHCGGNPPHLHSGGVCPYGGASSKSSSSSTTTTTAQPSHSSSVAASHSAPVAVSAPAPVVAKPAPRILGTTMRTFVNGKEISTYHYDGEPKSAVIVAEELAAYGFDVKWVEAWNTLYITPKHGAPVDGMPVAQVYDGQYLADVVDNNVCVRLVYDGTNSYVPVSYSLGNKMVIPVDELKCLGAFRYDAAENAVYLN